MRANFLVFPSYFLFGVVLSRSAQFVEGSDHDDRKYVTCGSAVKLTHIQSGGKYYLNSPKASVNSGSGQQLVTLVPDRTKSSALWLVQESHEAEPCLAGEPIWCGKAIRLTHLETQKNLHSHEVLSPLSKQQEVTAFGEDGIGDTGDDWVVVCSHGKTGQKLERNAPFRLQHVDTSKFLGGKSTTMFNERNCGGRCPVMNQLEAFARSQQDEFSLFRVELGVLLSK